MVLGAISSDSQPGQIIVSLAPSHHGPGHSGQLIGKRDGGDFGRHGNPTWGFLYRDFVEPLNACRQSGLTSPNPVLRSWLIIGFAGRDQ